MKPVTSQQRATVWRQRIRQQVRSGLAVQDFCRQQKCSPASFYLWKRKLADADNLAANPSQAVLDKQLVQDRSSGHPAAFLRVECPPPSFDNKTASAWVELSLPSVAIVRVFLNGATHRSTAAASDAACLAWNRLDNLV